MSSRLPSAGCVTFLLGSMDSDREALVSYNLYPWLCLVFLLTIKLVHSLIYNSVFITWTSLGFCVVTVSVWMWPRDKLTLPDERLTGVQQNFTALHNHPLDSQVLPDVLSLTHLVMHDSGRTKKKKKKKLFKSRYLTCLVVSHSF